MILTGVSEIGEGILTVLTQIAADELGMYPEDITIGDNDTARVPEAAHVGCKPADLYDWKCSMQCMQRRKEKIYS